MLHGFAGPSVDCGDIGHVWSRADGLEALALFEAFDDDVRDGVGVGDGWLSVPWLESLLLSVLSVGFLCLSLGLLVSLGASWLVASSLWALRLGAWG
jgi:hypothetical protein